MSACCNLSTKCRLLSVRDASGSEGTVGTFRTAFDIHRRPYFALLGWVRVGKSVAESGSGRG